MSGAPPVTVIVAYEALPDMVDTARAELEALIELVVAREPDCLGIRMYADVTAPQRLLLIEQWTSVEAFTGPHMQTPHLQAFMERARALIAGPPELRFWSEVAVALPASGRLDA